MNYPSRVTSLPDEIEFIGLDWKEQELYKGDEVYYTDSGYVLKEDVQEFMEAEYGSIIELR